MRLIPSLHRSATAVLAIVALVSAALLPQTSWGISWDEDMPSGITIARNKHDLSARSGQIHLGIYAGGPVYKEDRRAGTIAELVDSKFTEIIVWSVHIDASGTLNLNMEFPLCEGGVYVGGKTHPSFAGDLDRLHAAGKRQITLGIGAAGSPAFNSIKDLIQKEGTGANSILRKNFSALREALPAVSTIDLNDEVTYDADSMTKFSVLLADLGFQVSLCPYRNPSVWQTVARDVNNQHPGAIRAVNLQCYGGGRGNNPGTWTFPGIPVYPGVWAKGVDASGWGVGEETTSSTTQRYAGWKKAVQTQGGFLWLYDEIQGKTGTFADAILDGLQGNTGKAGLKNGYTYTTTPSSKRGDRRLMH